MYVCNCAGVTHRELHSRLHQGATSLKELRAALGVCQGCGKCAREVGEVLKGRPSGEQGRATGWQTPAVSRVSY
jgi:bacterioferritin-associated ferredoxin